MKIRILVTLVLLCGVIFSGNPLSATMVSDTMAKKYAESKDICPVVKSCIKEGMNTQEIVKTGILMGHRPCYVIKCAADGGGTLDQIIYGALEAATTADVVSRCCMEAGFRAQDIAKILQQADDPAPVQSGTILPGGGRNDGVLLSPSKFK